MSVIEQDIYDHLEHFGVKGMHWGIRKEPDRSEFRRRAEKAKKYLDKASLLQTKISDLQVNSTGYTFQAMRNREKIQKLSIKRQHALDDAERKTQGKLSRNQKRVLVGATVAGSLLATYGAYTMVQSGEARRLITKGKDLFGDKHDPGWKFNRDLAKPDMNVDSIYKDVVQHINPDYGVPGTKMNCRRATFAYEMRRRGYDVVATRTSDGRGQTPVGIYNALSKEKDIVPSTKGGIFRKILTEGFQKDRGKISDTPFKNLMDSKMDVGQHEMEPGDIFKRLAKQPNGARGELGLRWFGGGGHSMAWEIVDGKPVVFDTQNGQVYRSTREFEKIRSVAVNAGITRLDNVPLNTNFLMRWVKNA